MPHSLSAVTVNSNAIVDPMFHIYFTDTTSNSVTLTLPTITADGLHFWFRNTDVNITLNTTTISSGAGNTIEKQATYNLARGTFAHFVGVGTNWYLIG